MLSQAKIQANVKNSRLSTGPRTEEGKDASRANAYKHGLAAAGLIPEAARELWEETYERFCKEFGSDLATKRVLMQKMTSSIVRERFCDEVELYLFEFAAATDAGLPLPAPQPGNHATAFSFFKHMGLEKALQLVHRYRTTAMRQFKQSHDALLRTLLIDRRLMKENMQAQRQANDDYVNAPLPGPDLSKYLNRVLSRRKPTASASTTEIKR